MLHSTIFSTLEHKISLDSLGIEIPLHPNAKYAYKNYNSFSPLWTVPEGECNIEYVSLLPQHSGCFLFPRFHITASVRDNIKGHQLDFVKGHQEAHAAVYLGQSGKLFEEAKNLRLRFFFFDEQDAALSDEVAEEYLSLKTEFNLETLSKRGLITGENIANIGGLIALIKGDASAGLISETKNRISRMEQNPYPKESMQEYLFGLGLRQKYLGIFLNLAVSEIAEKFSVTKHFE